MTEISETVLEQEAATDSHSHHHLYRIATLQERFASFVVDGVINIYLIAAWALLLAQFLRQKPLAFKGTSQTLFITSSIAIHLLYYLFFEGTLCASPGKMLGGLIVHKKGGGNPSLLAIFVRCISRVIDYPLFFLTGLGLMEFGRKTRRLGDFLAGTVVLRRMPYRDTPQPREPAPAGGATLRTITILIDLVPVIVFTYGLLLLIPVQRGLVSLVAVNLLPFVVLVYFSLAESLFQTTLGKFLFGLKVVQESRDPCSFAAILLRNLFRVVDLNPVGYFCALLSSRKQRPGDIAAGTLVVHHRRTWRHGLAVPYFLILAATVGLLGWMNPQSFYRNNYLLRIGNRSFHPIPLSLQRRWFQSLHLERLELAFNESEVNERRKFDHGDVIFVLTRVSGFLAQGEQAWVQVDLKVRDPRRNIVLDRMNVINASITVGPKKYADLATRFALHPQATPGRYELELTLRDRHARTAVKQVVPFTVQ